MSVTVNANTLNDDYKTRTITLFQHRHLLDIGTDDFALATAAGYKLIGAQPTMAAIGIVPADPFHDWPNTPPPSEWPNEMEYLISVIHAACESGMPLPQRYIVSQTSISALNATWYGWDACKLENGAVVFNLEGIPVVIGDEVDVFVGASGWIGGYWEEFGVIPIVVI